MPVFDIARIERTGDAVIGGRAAPGAIVELLRNGERHDRAVADQSGQFVMVPPRLPPGDYELTLRSRQPDGKRATSKQSVVVALAEVESRSGTVPLRAEVPFNGPETVGANRSVLNQAVGSSQAHQPSQPPVQIAKRRDIAVSQLPHTTAAAPLSDGGSPPAVVVPKIATTVVSRGDSLWRISRVTYGAAMRYAVVYKANQDQNSKSKSYLSRPDLSPSDESALKSGGNSSACTRDGCTPFLLALDHARLAIAMRRRRWPSDAEHSEKTGATPK